MKKYFAFFSSTLFFFFFLKGHLSAQNIAINTDGTTGATLLHTKNTIAATDNILRIENTIGGNSSGINFLNSTTANASWLLYVPGSSSNLRLQRSGGTDIVTFYNTGDALVGNAAFVGNLGINNAGANNSYGINITGATSGWRGISSDLTSSATNYSYFASSSAALNTATKLQSPVPDEAADGVAHLRFAVEPLIVLMARYWFAVPIALGNTSP